MLYAIYCTDKPDSADIRAANRPDHLKYLKSHANQVVLAGPTQSDDLKEMNGSLLVMEFIDKSAAEFFANNDPYAVAGLFESVIIRPWKMVYPQT